MQRTWMRGTNDATRLSEEFKENKKKLARMIKNSKERCRKEFYATLDRDPWGRPYRASMSRMPRRMRTEGLHVDRARDILDALFLTIATGSRSRNLNEDGDDGAGLCWRTSGTLARRLIRRILYAGVPQGSILGSLLWNLVYDGLLKVLKSMSHLNGVAFVGDLAVILVVPKQEGCDHKVIRCDGCDFAMVCRLWIENCS